MQKQYTYTHTPPYSPQPRPHPAVTLTYQSTLTRQTNKQTNKKFCCTLTWATDVLLYARSPYRLASGSRNAFNIFFNTPAMTNIFFFFFFLRKKRWWITYRSVRNMYSRTLHFKKACSCAVRNIVGLQPPPSSAFSFLYSISLSLGFLNSLLSCHRHVWR